MSYDASDMFKQWGEGLKRERLLKKQPSKWIVSVKGNHRNGEISVVRENNLHGQRSYGWPEKGQKEIVACSSTTYQHVMYPVVWKYAIKIANETVEKYNLKEGW